MNDPKGGGLLLLTKKSNGKQIEKINTNHQDVMISIIKIHGFKFCLILVYFSVRHAEDTIRIREVVKHVIENNNLPTLVIVDFNGHVSFLDDNPTHHKGHYLLNIAEQNNLIILNEVPTCTGRITWHRGTYSSVIDYALANYANVQTLSFYAH